MPRRTQQGGEKSRDSPTADEHPQQRHRYIEAQCDRQPNCGRHCHFTYLPTSCALLSPGPYSTYTYGPLPSARAVTLWISCSDALQVASCGRSRYILRHSGL